jgi:hypothetical protein
MGRNEFKDRHGQILELDEVIVAVESEFRSAPLDNSDVLSKRALQSISLLAEAYDQCGQFKKAIQVIKSQAENCREEFGFAKFRNSNFQDKRNSEIVAIAKQKVWICLIYAHLLHRDEDYDLALKYLDTCETVSAKIRSGIGVKEGSQSWQLFGTRTRIALQKAHILFELGDIDAAERLGREALRLCLQRLESKMKIISASYKKNSSPYIRLVEREEVYARQTYAKILSFCQARHLRADGRLHDCLKMQQIGRICLHDMNQGFLQRMLFDVEICITRRLLAEESMLFQRNILGEVDGLLKEFKHAEIQYRRKLLIEKLAILIQSLDTTKSIRGGSEGEVTTIKGSIVDVLRELSDEANGQKWRWRVSLLESKLAEVERNYDRALDLANYVHSLLENTSNRAGFLKAKLQKVSILRSLKDYDKSISHLEEILSWCRRNDSYYRVCELWLAECFLLRGEKTANSRDIQLCLKHWTNYKEIGSEDGKMVAMENRLKARFENSERSFFLLERNENDLIDLDVKKNTQKLRLWLYNQAIQKLKTQNRPLTNENIAKELGFRSPSALNNYFSSKRSE